MTDPIRAAREAAALCYRVQDAEGRGPYRPGMSDRWADPDGPDHPPVFAEFGMDCINDIPHGWHAGSAFGSLDQMRTWFSASECGRLAKLGYRLVALGDCRIVRQSERQLLIARRRPFRLGAIIVPWPHSDARAALDPWMLAEAVEKSDG